MSIYAQRTTSAFNLQNIPVKFNNQSPTGTTLVWDAFQKAFIGLAPNLSTPYITGAANLGTSTSIGLFSAKVNDVLNFKEIIGGVGIAVLQDDESITIRANFSADRLSVPGSYRITIGNDAVPNSDSVFEIWTAEASTDNPIVVTPTIVFPFVVPNLYTGIDPGTGVSYIQTINGTDFFGAGLRPGMWIYFSGTPAQDGQWQIQEIINTVVGSDTYSTVNLVQSFQGPSAFNLGGPCQFVRFQQADLYIPAPNIFLPFPYDPTKCYTLTSYSIDFGPLGYNLQPGMIVELRGTQAELGSYPSNDGNYTIYEVTPKGSTPFEYSSILFTSDQPLPGPQGMVFDPQPTNPLITLTIATFETPTGFQVDQYGAITGTSLTVTGTIQSGSSTPGSNPPSQPNDLVRLDYLQSEINSLSASSTNQPLRYFYSSF